MSMGITPIRLGGWSATAWTLRFHLYQGHSLGLLGFSCTYFSFLAIGRHLYLFLCFSVTHIPPHDIYDRTNPIRTLWAVAMLSLCNLHDAQPRESRSRNNASLSLPNITVAQEYRRTCVVRVSDRTAISVLVYLLRVWKICVRVRGQKESGSESVRICPSAGHVDPLTEGDESRLSPCTARACLRTMDIMCPAIGAWGSIHSCRTRRIYSDGGFLWVT